jgi:hypothetical protein
VVTVALIGLAVAAASIPQEADRLPARTQPAPADHAVTVPSALDGTGGRDVSAALTAFIAGVPNGSRIMFPAGAVYRLDDTLELTNRTDLVLDGNGATLTTVPSQVGTRAQVRIVGGRGIVLRDLTIRGANPAGGTVDAYLPALEWQHGVDLRGVDDVQVAHVSVMDVSGDCFYVGLGTGPASGRWSAHVRIHDSTCRRNGRQGVAVTAGRDILVDHCSFADIALMAFDVEPNPGGGASRVAFKANVVRRGSRYEVLGVVGAGRVQGVTLIRNILVDKPLTVLLSSPKGVRRTDFVIADNVSDAALYASAPASVVASGIDGLTITGNHQRMGDRSRVFARVTDSCMVLVTENVLTAGAQEALVQPRAC